MFDLPVISAAERKEYRNFRKYLIKSGFIMLQESVYCKLTTNSTTADMVIENVKKHKPPEGLVQAVKITEKQYGNMVNIVGEKKSNILDSEERLIII